jgi:DNA replication protein DnaC
MGELVSVSSRVQQLRERMLASMPESAKALTEADIARRDTMSEEELYAEYRSGKLQAEKQATARLREQKQRDSGLNGKQKLNTFAKFMTYRLSLEQRQAWESAVAFASNWPNVDKGLMFYGPPGRGKDHLLHAIVNKLGERPSAERPIMRYWYALDIEAAMIEEWRRTDRDPENTRTEELMKTADILLIGDLPRVLLVKSPQVVNAVLRTINQAESTGKPVLCISSNYDVSWYDKNLSDEVLGVSPVASRLCATCECIHVTSPNDARRAK